MIEDCSACAESANQLAACLRELHRLGLRRHSSFADSYRDYLETGCRLLGMETGIVSCIQGDRYEVLAVVSEEAGLIVGDVFPLGETYCSRVIELGATVAVPAIGRDEAMSCHPGYRNTGLESYIAAPIWVFDRIYGTLNFTAADPRQGSFTKANVELLEMMALSLGRIVERELTEREREVALARMNENIERFESAFQYAAIGMALVSLEGQWLRVNRALVDLLGYSEDELLRMDFQRITHPDDLDTDLELVRELLDKKRDSYRMEKRYFHRDGHIVWGLLSVSVVRFANGRLRYFVSQIQDITDRKLAEQPSLDTATAISAFPSLGGGIVHQA
ncbi:GAF domain-containing protein [Parahaliea mediterranea]|uniref:histidine kinase n=1 Tax=Parahaliea mediterranea TaxID=651086 RepID=A0A939DG09_9GAMM|nr:GAF domain-containing protein [Parahaliea mediterranea]MBN7796827.1 PAS domain S-box protein [Parahaliea mediterranea]